MFTQVVNSKTGEREWAVMEQTHADDDWDCTQEMARSRFADMILDSDRNRGFRDGLASVIREKKRNAEPAHVVDIGCGTGLLSMMAVKEKANSVQAIEVFQPMAACARQVIANNGMSDEIKIVASRSTEVSALERKATVIVAEVFDTELIGEGALRTFKEALERLAEPDCRVVPSTASCYAVLVESDFIARFHTAPRTANDVTSPLVECPGTGAVFDIQMSELPPNSYRLLTPVTPIARFDFEHSDKIHYEESNVVQFEVSESGRIDALFFWWTLDMDGHGDIIISMEPKWSASGKESSKQYEWRDHWMQAVYYPIGVGRTVQRSATVDVRCAHDEYSWYFEVLPPGQVADESSLQIPRSACSCSVHNLLSRQQNFRASELLRNSSLKMSIAELCGSACRSIVVIGDLSLLSIVAALAVPEKSIVAVEKNPRWRSVLKDYTAHYHLSNLTIASCPADIGLAPSVVLIDVQPAVGFEPWDGAMWARERVRELREAFPSDQWDVWPKVVDIHAVGLRLEDAWRMGADVETVEGFDLSAFDRLNRRARDATDSPLDTQPLWEYASSRTSDTTLVVSIPLEGSVQERSSVRVQCHDPNTNSLALWSRSTIGKTTLDYGLLTKSDRDREEWFAGARQALWYVPGSSSTCHLPSNSSVQVDVTYCEQSSQLDFSFGVRLSEE